MKKYLFKAFLIIVSQVSIIANLKSYAQEESLPLQLKIFKQQQLQKKANEEIMVDFVVKAKTNEAKQILLKNGAKIKYQKGELISVRIPLDRVEYISNSNHFSPLQFSIMKGIELNDTMRMRNRVNQVHLGLSPLDKAYDGDGIIIGFIDSGIDYTHPDFQNSDGTTRVLAIWDQTMGFDATFTPSKYGYGQTWDSAQINDGLCTHDINGTGHGSTVAGCAAGNALASGYNLGIAPKADIIMVESDFNRPNWTVTVADAVDYIFSLADFYGKPCIINASVGTYLGSHDGTDDASVMIDQLLKEKPGRLMASAAGNSGRSGKYHLHNDVNSDTTFTWLNINMSSAFGFPAGYADIWSYKTEFDDVHFAIGADKNSPNFEFRGRTNFHNLLLDDMVDKMTKDSIVVGGKKLADIEYYVTEVNGSYELEVFIPEPDSSQYYYRFITTTQTTGKYDMWSGSFLGLSDIISDGDLPSIGDFSDIANYIEPDTLQTVVSSWTCLPSVITVANYVNTDRYIDYNGDLQIKSNNIPRDLARSSSKGPTRNGIIKPDIGATGALTFSCGTIADIMNRRVSNPTNLHVSGWHVSNGGTSMASPVVAGIGALLLQSCPNLTPENFKDIITSTTFSDEYTGTLPNFAFGYGKIDAYASLSKVMIDEPTITQSENTLNAPIASAYKWYKNGEEIDGANTQQISVDENAQYMVEVFNQYGCSKFSQPIDFALTMQLNSQNAIVYPNPTDDFLYIQIDTNFTNVTIKIVDVLGKEVLFSRLLKSSEKINLSHLESAVYFVVLKNDNQEILKTSIVKN